MYQALYATSETIRQYIEKQITGVTSAGMLRAYLDTPAEIGLADGEGISVWLYRVVRDPERFNDPPERVGWNQIKTPPLPLRLHYLITPIAANTGKEHGTATGEQLLLGKILQMFHSHPVLRGTDLKADFEGTSTELHMRLEPMSLEEITRVWEALDGSYQLSVSYEVSVVNIDAETEPESITPVEVARPEYGLIVS
jgi:hypothetical protein